MLLTVCSSDGYVSFAKFPLGSLGIPLEDSDVPIIVKQTYPAVYNYARPENLNEDAENVLLDDERLDINADAGALDSPHDVQVQTEGNERGEYEKATKRIAQMVVDVSADFSQHDQSSPATDENEPKKKRIAPVDIKASSSSSSSSSTQGAGNENQSPQSFAATESAFLPIDIPNNVDMKQKKRITPYHVVRSDD